ncbi:MAG: TM0996/MTH895 family glutaredoxin-like protein [Bacteroidetes bacterium]|jgi:small redox-active disulfide protein 2|nr:TM0996/MTH895 family glutaredoxin-like protein [Bacteroidota bacterium]MBU1578919.1 TM0996/MTH895 family glutaredoxin-like protein [Bacteroidota bacterium]MBU2556984.1 TM0996/MTH895 family glutaredoxin-like protein [Bacteroidota bacterium]
MSKSIKILGTGCPKCKTLEQSVRNVVAEHQLDAEITKVEDIMDIMNYGVMRTPGLVVDEKVVVSGRVPSSTEIKDFLS